MLIYLSYSNCIIIPPSLILTHTEIHTEVEICVANKTFIIGLKDAMRNACT